MQPLKILFTAFSMIFIFMNGFAQTPLKNYDKEWKKVNELIHEKRLPKSALAEVKKIYALAKKEKNDAQVIKAVIHMAGLQQEIREDNELLAVKEIETEIEVSKEPVTSILKSMLAEIYWGLYQQYRWRLYQRTETVDFKKDDLTTWSTGDFHKKISALYLESLSSEKLLQQTKLKTFDALLMKGNMRHLRPTLYDLLAHRALEYFENDERDIAKPAYAFEIGSPDAFAPALQFISKRFATSDTVSLKYKALLVYQELIAFHLQDAIPDALLDADIARLTFVNRHSTHPDKKQLYRDALIAIATKHADLPAASQAWYLLAQEHKVDGDSYNPTGDTTYRYSKIRAVEILERLVRQKDSSEGRTNAINMLNDIRVKSFKFSLEKVNTPGQPFRVLVNYNNTDKLFFRVIKPPESLKEKLLNYYDETVWNELLAVPALRNWQQPLPATNDHQMHGVEIKVDALPAGDYILIASSNEFSKREILGARQFYVSNISYVNQGLDHFLFHRETGQPLQNVTVQVWQRSYNYSTSKYVSEKEKQYKTNNNGFFRMVEPINSRDGSRRDNYRLDISWNQESLFMDDWLYDTYYYQDNINTTDPLSYYSIFLFSDRSIYRPGQTVYFKGIAIANDREIRNKVLANIKTTVYLRNANHQDVDSMVVATNEFGSFNGRFQLPQGILNGQFAVYVKSKGQVDFSVEEYKRPKFLVEYEKLKITYKVNDKIAITGTAKGYAGNNIDGALVKYRVVRQPRFLYPWMFWRGWYPPSAPMEIAHGETKTDKDGKFIIKFEAIPDKSIDKKYDPAFDYKIYADVTDINGETRSGETIVSVSYKSLLLRVDLPQSLPVDSLKIIKIRTENMSGEFVPANLVVSIYKLKEEKRLIRPRYWQQPDQFVMSKEEYIRNFTFDEYKNESDPKSWEREAKVDEKRDSSRVNGEWSVVSGKLTPGWYSIEIVTTDKDGQEVKDVRYVQLVDEKSNRLMNPQYLWSQGSNPIEPGERTNIKLGSSADNVFVIQQITKQLGVGSRETGQNYEFISFNNEKKSFEFGATEADRGGYGVQYFFVKHNRFFNYGDVIMVPWTNKDLTIEYSTFRDKTLPGSEEKWTIKINGYKKEQVAAEMLASMYDASLDQFRPHQWNKPSIWPVYSNLRPWNFVNNFADVESQQKSFSDREWMHVEKNYDQLFTWLLNSHDRNPRLMRLPKPMMAQNDMAAGREEFEVSNKKNGLLAPPPGKVNLDSTGTTQPKDEPVIPRKNFNETAFFFPELRTDANGSIEFSFTLPEALTRWKFQALTHTKELALGYSSKEIVTQKELMVQPNAPRFLREGDKIEFTAKIVNLTDKEFIGYARLHLFDAATNEPLDGGIRNLFPKQYFSYFTVAAGQSEAVSFPIEVPYHFNRALVWRVEATAGNFSDGEEAAIPVLTNRMLVTESLPINMRRNGTKNIIFDKLLKSGESETLQHHAVTIEYTSNPAWYAVQALPYLMEYPYECAEQVWNRYYANALATHIANSAPKVRQIFESWKTKDTAALMSNLQKNEELKAVLLEETPWVLQAKNEEQQKRNIALLFDLVRMSKEMNSSLEKLVQMQSSNGGFVWFKGGPDDRYITQYIVTGIGHLQKLKGVKSDDPRTAKLNGILKSAINYLDAKIKEDYDRLVKSKANLKTQQIGYYEIQYLYMRSFFGAYPIAKASQTAYTYYRGQSKQFWVKQTKYMQGMIALSLFRTKEKMVPAAILKSLKETSINNEELGMYWKDQTTYGWFWFQAPIEMQALMIEAFHEISQDTATVDDLRTWLLKNKQTNNWKTTKATAEACYALLLQGTQWLTYEPVVEIKLGNATVDNKNSAEAGTGYFKKTIEGTFVQPNMGNISVSISSPINQLTTPSINQTSWGSIYWQYFEDLDKITPANTPLKLSKKLFVETNTDRGPVLTPVKQGDALKVGDKIKVRIELRVDRDMEYVHMKDMRASAMEPVNVLSGYKWQGGLGYYETTKDASTNFFFNYLRKGTYVFEYPLFITNKGNFSNGITTIQSMYAPEFTSHSEGIRINVE